MLYTTKRIRFFALSHFEWSQKERKVAIVVCRTVAVDVPKANKHLVWFSDTSLAGEHIGNNTKQITWHSTEAVKRKNSEEHKQLFFIEASWTY